MALIVAGDRSGVGKTTVTLAILAFLAGKNGKTQSFKVGPDYIDPMFHSLITGIPCRNLDPVLTSPDYVRKSFQRHIQNVDYAVIEGVMGLFDGIRHLDGNNSLNDFGSTAHIARILGLPVVLVLDCSSLSSSIAAIAFGYANLDPEINIAGVILNKVASDRHLELLETALETINMPILGVIRRNKSIAIGDRHLGLIPSSEIANIQSVFSHLAHLAQESFDWNQLSPLVSQQSDSTSASRSLNLKNYNSSNPVKIAVARDRAFNFYYQDNLDILAELGAELIFWSPLQDQHLPKDVQGFYFGGGFPEVFAQQLASNRNILKLLKRKIEDSIPTYAECGGLMYLCAQLTDLEQQTWPMVGAIPSRVNMQAKLTLGYRRAIALQNSSLIAVEQVIRGHEFHRSQVTKLALHPQWQLQGLHRSSLQFLEGWNIKQLHASYLHVHWGEYQHLAARFVQCCRNYKT